MNGASPAHIPSIHVPHIAGGYRDVPNPDYQQWVRSDQIVQAWLVGSLSKDILSVVLGAQTAQEVWVSLGNHFNRVSSSILFELQRSLQTVSKTSKTMSDYLKEIKGLCDQLNSVGSPVTEKKRFLQHYKAWDVSMNLSRPVLKELWTLLLHRRLKTLFLLLLVLKIVLSLMKYLKPQCLLTWRFMWLQTIPTTLKTPTIFSIHPTSTNTKDEGEIMDVLDTVEAEDTPLEVEDSINKAPQQIILKETPQLDHLARFVDILGTML